MTTNQTIGGVPRELLKRIYRHLFVEPSLHRDDGKKLRALLDAEPAPCAKSQVEPAAQPQGEPVAYQYRVTSTDGRVLFANLDDGWYATSIEHAKSLLNNPIRDGYSYEVRPLYAGQHAPVAVVLPERREPKHCWPRFGKLTATARVAAEEWNACIDEVTRLNTKE